MPVVSVQDSRRIIIEESATDLGRNEGEGGKSLGIPALNMTDMTKRNLELWTNMQQEFLKGVQPPKPDDKDD